MTNTVAAKNIKWVIPNKKVCISQVEYELPFELSSTIRKSSLNFMFVRIPDILLWFIKQQLESLICHQA